ncbi:MAG: transporter [Micrococcaceae bacterium]|nr:transporter [Micrococcaceae bacterium]
MDNTERQPWQGHRKGSAGYRRILLALLLAGIATFAQLYSVQGILPLLARDLRITAAEAGLTISAATIGLALAVLPWSFVADRYGRVRTMGAAIVAATVLGLAAPLAPTFPTLLILRVAEGIALAGVPASAIAYLNEEISRLSAAVAAGAYVAGTTLGGLLGRLLAGPLADLAGWRVAAMSVSAVAAVAAAGFLLLAPPTRGFRPVRAGNFPLLLARLLPQLRDRRLLGLYAQAFLLMGSFVSAYNYLGFRLEAPPYLLPATAVALIFLAYLAGTVSSRSAAGLSATLGRRRVLLGSILLMLAGLAATLAPALPVILAGLTVFTAGFFGAHSIASGWTGSLAVSGRAQAASLYNLSYYAGSSILGWAAGLVFQQAAWAGLVLALAVVCLVSAVLAMALLPQGTADRTSAGIRTG